MIQLTSFWMSIVVVALCHLIGFSAWVAVVSFLAVHLSFAAVSIASHK